MIDLGLSEADRKTLIRVLRGSRRIRTRLDVLDLDGNQLMSIGQHRAALGQVHLVTGEVTVDQTSDAVTRSMLATLYDPRHRLRLDSDSPGNGALYADRMLRAIYLVKVPWGWEEIPVFTGPITKLNRDGSSVTVEAQGMEFFALQPAWSALNLEKGMNKVDAIRRILKERAGESRFDFPEGGNSRLPRNVSIGRGDVPWKFAQRIAAGMDRQLFYDGRGRCRLRNPPDRVAVVFDSRLITTEPQVSFDMSEAKNAVRVRGRKLHEGKEELKGDVADDNIVTVVQVPTVQTGATAVAPKNHPLSPERLGRNGMRFFIPEFIEDDTIRSNKEAQQVANRVLNDRLRQAVDVSFDSLPMPFLEPLDMVRVVYDDLDLKARVQRFGFSLTTDGEMTVGYTRRVSRPARPRRINRS